MAELNKEIKQCSHTHTYYCSDNPNGEKGKCEYWKQCGVIAFFCKH